MSVDRSSPAKTLLDAQAALNFESPLESGDPRWEDLSAARGDDATVRLRRLFTRKPAGQALHAVFSSHRGGPGRPLS